MLDITIIRSTEPAVDLRLLQGKWLESAGFAYITSKSSFTDSSLRHSLIRGKANRFENFFGLLTSGSTGQPKIIIGSKFRAEQLVLLLHKLQDSEPVQQSICPLPLSYSYSFINQWLWSHVTGRELVLTRGFAAPDELLTALNQARDAMLCLVGSQVALIRRYFPEQVFPGVIRLHFAGGRFPQEHLDFLHTVFPNAQIYNNYGCAEAMPRLTLRKAEDADEAAHVGYALPGVEMKTDENDRILFRSPYRAVAWIDDDGLHEIDDDEWIPSGDLGEPTEDGGWRLLGRSGDVFKRHGEKISLHQVMNTVNRSWGGEAACYLETDPTGEQGYVLALAPEPDEKLLRELLMAFRKNYKRSHWPLRIEAMESMPALANGKPDARAIAGLQDKRTMWRQRI